MRIKPRRDARLLLAVGVFGRPSRLCERIEKLLSRGQIFSARISRARVTVGIGALLALAAAASRIPNWIAFAQAEPGLRFEVASIKPDKPEDRRNNQMLFLPGGRLSVTNMPLCFLIANAYGLPFQGVRFSGCREVGLRDRYDIEAAARSNDSTGPVSENPQ